MLGQRLILRTAVLWLPMIFWLPGVGAQTCVVLSAPTVAPNGTASMELSLFSERGSEPAAFQWTFQYDASNVVTLTVEDGPLLASAGKTTMCAGGAAAYTCMIAGANRKTIANGTIAKVTVTLGPAAPRPNILVKSPMGASSMGYLIQAASKVRVDAGAEGSFSCGPRLPKGGPVVR